MVRFYLGKDTLEKYYGDDWNDTPYECNAGTVYDEYISGTADLVFPLMHWYWNLVPGRLIPAIVKMT